MLCNDGDSSPSFKQRNCRLQAYHTSPVLVSIYIKTDLDKSIPDDDDMLSLKL